MRRMSRTGVSLILAALWLAPAAQGRLAITEIMSQSIHAGPTDCDWWELTNTGPAAVNLRGYSWDDDHMGIGVNQFGSITIAAGESIIIRGSITVSSTVWKAEWGLGDDVKVYDPSYFGGTFSAFGSVDGVWLYDLGGMLVASVSYPARVNGFSNAWNTAGLYLGISVAGENGAYLSMNPSADVASPGYAVYESLDKFTETIYWTDKNNGGRIQRVNYNSAGVETLLTWMDGLSEPRGLAIDVANEKMYWADTTLGAIYRADLNGSNIVELVDGLVAPADIALDSGNGKLYWTDSGTGAIQRMNLDGPAQIENVVTGVIQPYYMELDLAGGKVYWSDVDSPTIHRANLNGTGIETFITGLSRVRDIVVDRSGGKVYWGDRASHKIQRANLNGTAVEDLYGPLDGLDRPHGLALDVKAGKVYWTDTVTNTISRGNMDGSGSVESLVTGLDGPWGIVAIALGPDINKDGNVDAADFALFARRWRDSQCGPCGGADFTGDYQVGADDLSVLAESWLGEP